VHFTLDGHHQPLGDNIDKHFGWFSLNEFDTLMAFIVSMIALITYLWVMFIEFSKALNSFIMRRGLFYGFGSKRVIIFF
jgi:hypothetical protein